MNEFLSCLDEQQRRWNVELEAQKIDHVGDTLLPQITGMDVEMIRRGRRELDEELVYRPTDRVRTVGAVPGEALAAALFQTLSNLAQATIGFS